MFNSIALDVVIGLIFIFLLYSLLASILQEFVAKLMGLRSRMLLKAISRLLDDDDDFNKITGPCRVFQFKGNYFEPFKKRPFTEIFYDHPNIKYLGKNGFTRKPAYISDALFAETLIKILRTNKFTGTQNQMEIVKDHLENDEAIELKNYKVPQAQKKTLKIGTETKAGLLEMVYDSGNDLEKFKARVEQWYNEMMDRAEGWYTKQTRLILFVIGFILAMNFNVNTIAIATLLANNNTARNTLVESAGIFKMPQATNNVDSEISKKANDFVRAQIDSANKVLGLGYPVGENWCSAITQKNSSALPGWIITALAISLGGPFWFDLLQKIMAIRQAGAKPAETPATGAIPKSQTISPNDVKNRVG